MANLKFLTNGNDPNTEKGKNRFMYNHRSDTPQKKEAEWNKYLAYLSDKVIARPMATAYCTVEQLEYMGLVGIYEKTETR
jgi:hypothetical protein